MSQLDNVKGTTPEPSAKTDSSSTVATAPQYFTLGAGGEIPGAANRTKDVEFDLSIPQIKRYITIQKKDQEQLSLLKKSKEARLPDELDEIKLRTIRDVLWSYMQTIDSCSNQDVILVDSDLGLSEWLEDALAQALRNRTSNPQAYRRLRPTGLALISHKIYFVVTPTGDMISAWKLVRVSASNSPSLASITPKNKDTLIVSVGGQNQAAEAEIQTPQLRSVLTCRRRSKTEPVSCVIELGLPHSAARDDDLDAAPAGKH